MPTNITDADLFTEIVREIQQLTAGKDRRQSERHAYPTVQMAVPDEDPEAVVAPAMFATIPCNDISTNGISLVLPCPPGFRRAVVAMGESPHVIHMVVEVQRYERHPMFANQFLVGCRFVHRLPEAGE